MKVSYIAAALALVALAFGLFDRQVGVIGFFIMAGTWCIVTVLEETLLVMQEQPEDEPDDEDDDDDDDENFHRSGPPPFSPNAKEYNSRF